MHEAILQDKIGDWPGAANSSVPMLLTHKSFPEVWFVTAADQLMQVVPPPAGLPGDMPKDKWDAIGAYRTSRLLSKLYRACGHPSVRYAPDANFDGIETLVAMPFDPPAQPAKP